MHVHGHGAASDLARKLKPALDLIAKGAAPSSSASAAAPATAAGKSTLRVEGRSARTDSTSSRSPQYDRDAVARPRRTVPRFGELLSTLPKTKVAWLGRCWRYTFLLSSKVVRRCRSALDSASPHEAHTPPDSICRALPCSAAGGGANSYRNESRCDRPARWTDLATDDRFDVRSVFHPHATRCPGRRTFEPGRRHDA